MEGDVAATYTLIYHFLKAQSHNKAAEAVKKAAKPIVVLRDDIEPKEPSLEDIIKRWKEKENTESKDTDSLSEDDDSSDDFSSDSEDGSVSASSPGDASGSESDDDTSDSDDNSVDLDEGTISKSSPPKPLERDTSVTLSSTGENARAAIQVGASSKKSTENTGKVTKKDEKTSTGSDSSDSDSSDSDSSSSESSASGGSDAESSSNSSGSSDNSDSSDQDDKKTIKPMPPNRTGTAAGQSALDSGSESEDELDLKPQRDAHVAKKRKISENEGAVTTAVTDRSQQIVRKKEKLPPKVKERFQRVKVQNLEPKQLLDNDYETRGGVMNDYGERAHRDLIATRGAGFRKEKNKKKRGSYRGGEITMEDHSIRFNF